jgi:type VI secretion system protein ImpH
MEPGRLPVGLHTDPKKEVVRFRSRLSMEFPPSEIHEIRHPAKHEESPPEMVVAFMGLAGPQGALPIPYTELMMERARYKDRALAEFLDLFVHRLLSFFYRAWEKYRFPVAYERDQNDRFTGHLFHLVGMGTTGLKNRQQFPDPALLLYTGLIAQHPHSSTALGAILADYFQVPVQVLQFWGQWLAIDPESQTFLGQANSQLGVNAIVGSRVWDQQSKLRIRVGPMRFAKFSAFLPPGPLFQPVSELVRLVTGMEYDFDFQLVLQAAEVPPCVLSSNSKEKPMLGWTTWLKTQPFEQDDPQVILNSRQ